MGSARQIFTRDFNLAFLAQLSVSGTFNLLIPTLPLYLAALGSREEEIGILIGALSVSSLALRPLVGRALLYIPEKRFMFLGALLIGIASLAYIFAPPFWSLLWVRIFQGIGQACFYTASVIFVANISPESLRTRSIAYFFLAFNFAFALAPTFGMYLINTFEFPVLFAVCALFSFGSLFLTTRLRRHPSTAGGPPPKSSDGKLPSLQSLTPAVITFFGHFIWGALAAFFPLYAVGVGVRNPGFFFGVYAVTLIAGRAFGAKILDRNRDKVMVPCLLCYVVATVLLAFSKTMILFILIAIIWGMGSAFLFPALVAHTLDRAGASRGPAMGTFMAASDFGSGLGPVIAGIVLHHASYPAMFLVLALIGCINLWYFLKFLRPQEPRI